MLSVRYIKMLFVLCLLLSVWVFIASCHSSPKAKLANADKDTVAFIQLPAPQPVTEAERTRINKASELWYDTVLKQRGFNGGMIVAKSGNIIFEKYTGTGHLPGTDSITQNTPMHVASVSKTFTAMAVLYNILKSR